MQSQRPPTIKEARDKTGINRPTTVPRLPVNSSGKRGRNSSPLSSGPRIGRGNVTTLATQRRKQRRRILHFSAVIARRIGGEPTLSLGARERLHVHVYRWRVLLATTVPTWRTIDSHPLPLRPRFSETKPGDWSKIPPPGCLNGVVSDITVRGTRRRLHEIGNHDRYAKLPTSSRHRGLGASREFRDRSRLRKSGEVERTRVGERVGIEAEDSGLRLCVVA